MIASDSTSRPPRFRPRRETRLPILVLSLDFELRWGCHDRLGLDIDAYRENLEGVREVIPELLRLFGERGLRATWATVGAVACRDWAEYFRRAPAPPRFADTRQAIDPRYADLDPEGRLHFAPELVDRIRSAPGQELGTHTFSHLPLRADGVGAEDARADLAAAQALWTERFGAPASSLTFPRNQHAFLEVVRAAGIQVWRGNPPVWFQDGSNGAAEGALPRVLRLLDDTNPWTRHSHALEGAMTRGSLFLRADLPGAMWRLHVLRIRRELARLGPGQIFHLWWHPHNLGADRARRMSRVREVLDAAAERVEARALVSHSMGDLVARSDGLSLHPTVPSRREPSASRPHCGPRPSPSVTEIDAARWDRVVRQFPDRTVFHSLAWLDTLCAARGGRVRLTAVTERNRVAAVWPCIELRRGPFRVLGSPLPGTCTTYLGPLFAPGADASAALATFLGDPRFRAVFFSCRALDRSRVVDLSPFGFTVVKRFDTSWIDLDRDEEALWGSLKSECRTRIRKARRLGVEVRVDETLDFLDDFWTMTLETFARSGARPTHDRAFVAEMWQRLHPVGALRVLSAFHEGSRIATLVLPHDDRTTYYWAGATFERARAIPAGNLLHWEAILDARRLGLTGYDLISAQGGPGRFKRSLGAQVVHAATYWERTSSALMGFLKRRYESYRRRTLRAES